MNKLAVILLALFLVSCSGTSEQKTIEEVSDEIIKETQEMEQTTRELEEATDELEKQVRETESEVDSLLQDI